MQRPQRFNGRRIAEALNMQGRRIADYAEGLITLVQRPQRFNGRRSVEALKD